MQRETGTFYTEINPFFTQKRTVPTHHRFPDVLRWCSRLLWMWAKARSERGALIRSCGDEVVSNEARNGSFYTEINPFCTQKRTVPTHHRFPDALRWCSRLAMDVGEGQKRTRCIDSLVRRQGGVECSEKRGHYFTRKSTPSSAHRNEPFRPTTALPTPSVGVPASLWMWAKGQKRTRCIDSLVRRRGGVE
jgi:hypothetical protein